MIFVSYAAVVIMALRCISFGIYSITERNITGGIAAILLALGSVVSSMYVLS